MKDSLKTLAVIAGVIMLLAGVVIYAIFRVNNPDLTGTRILISYSSVWLKPVILMIVGMVAIAWGVRDES